MRAHQDAMPETLASFCRGLAEYAGDFPEAARPIVAQAVRALAAAEGQMWDLPEPALERMTMPEFVEYRNLLYAKEHFFANRAEQLDLLHDALSRLLFGIAEAVPARGRPSPFTIPLIHLLPEPRLTVERIWGTLGDYHPHGLFKALCRRLYRNMCAVSGRDPHDPSARRPLVMPTQSALPLDQLADAYLGGTPFHAMLMAPVPLPLTYEQRYSHMHLLGGSGAGKTTLIEALIRDDLASDDPPSIVLIDPHSDLVRRLVRSELGDDRRVILIDPRDTKYPLALNPFALNQERLAAYDEATREQVSAGVIETFGYLWSGLTNLTLTGKQEVLFRYVTRLMLSLPEAEGRNATILDMLKLMSDPAPYARAIEQLPEIPRDFFLRDFASKGFEGTREQIRYRLQAIIENPTMARLFTAPETRIDFFTEMNRGAVILVDTAKDFLKEGSAIFGKLLISLILQAVMERAAIPEAERTPTFIMVDEAGSFFSSNIDDLLTESRKYKAGILLAHQYMDQASSSLRASLAANTAIKFASGLSAADAAAMARDMRTTADFILAQPKLQFAAYIRGATASAVSVPVPRPRPPRERSRESLEAFIARNRMRVSAVQATLPPPPVALAGPDEDISADW
ncbi:MAG: type IV secretion system DNA-binding domain-containing protein [Sphingomonas sp.]|nr:type IV secretion system DNA-binding domain-containing protein [Sphingomonas sp.]